MAERPMEHFTVDGVNIFEVTDAKARQDVSDLKDDFDEFPTGYYEEMTVGNSEQLVSTVFTEDQTPYLFRTTGGSADVGDREYVDAIVGATVAWNQLVQNGNFESTDGWFVTGTMSATDNVCTYTPNAQGAQIYAVVPYVNTHKYLASVDIKTTTATSSIYLRTIGTNRKASVASTSWQNVSCIFVSGTTNDNSIGIRDERSGDWDDIQIRNVQLFDLTQMFGSTIADYIYGLETANAGAGVAWFKKLFPKPYYEYDTGTLKSVEGVSAHKTVGFNAWDEVAEAGTINSSGQNAVNANCMRSKNYIPALPSTVYYFMMDSKYGYSTWVNIACYDADKNYLGAVAPNVNNTFTTLANTAYMRFNTSDSWGTKTYDGGICINLSWDGEKDGQYEPYVEHTYALDSSLTLRGIPKLDAQNNLYYDGDEYLPDGTVNRRYGVVDLGTLDWSLKTGASGVFYSWSLQTIIKKTTKSAIIDNHICPKLNAATKSSVYDSMTIDNAISVGYQGGVYLRITSCTTINEVTSALSGVMLVYELATPTTETAEPYQQTQICDDFGTEEFISTSPVPVGHNTRYAPNLRAKLEMAPDSPDGDGVYVVQQSNGENEYIPLGSTTVIQDILARLTALENA